MEGTTVKNKKITKEKFLEAFDQVFWGDHKNQSRAVLIMAKLAHAYKHGSASAKWKAENSLFVFLLGMGRKIDKLASWNFYYQRKGKTK